MSVGKSSGVSSIAIETRQYFKHGFLFILIGLLIYAGVYIGADTLVYKYAHRNRFFTVKTAPYSQYDTVILGASHAAVFDYLDMNAQLEQLTKSKIINLAVVGGGVTVNRLMMDYFLVRHQTRNVVYFLDSFAFYYPEWNEDRLNDTRLFNRAPFDPDLARILLRDPSSRSVALDYLSGFSKINNADRFKPDLFDDEVARFRTTFSPISQIDEERIKYLYPRKIDESVFQFYVAAFEDLVRYLKAQNVSLIIVKPPVPLRFYRMLPNEDQFDKALKATLDKYGIEFHDFSLVANDERYFYNSDHLNQAGVLNFYESYLKQVMPQ
jgi:hypothetical protein